MKFIPPSVTYNADGWPVVTQPGELIDFLAARPGKAQARCIYVPALRTEVEEHLEAVIEIVREAKNIILYIDEVDKFCSPGAMKAQGSSYWNRSENRNRKPRLASLFDDGRHDGVAVIVMSRRPAQVNGQIRGNVNEMRIFRSTEGNVVDYFRQRCGDKAAEMMQTLGNYQYVLWQDGKEPIVAGGKRK